MSFGKRGLVLAMEEENTEIVENEEVTAVEVPAEVEADVAEVAQGEREVAEMAEAIEEAAEDAETLDEIREVMIDSVEPAEGAAEGEEGEGLDETAAEVAEVAVEALCARLGIRDSKFATSMESFGSKNSRAHATNLAIESIGEKVKKVWEAIKAAVARMWESVKGFITKLFDSNARLESSANAMLKKAEALDDKATAENEMENASIAKAFGGDVDLQKAKEVLAKHSLFTESTIVAFTGFTDLFSAADAIVGEWLAGKEIEAGMDKLGELGKKVLAKAEQVNFADTKQTDKGDECSWGPFVNGVRINYSVEVSTQSLPKFNVSVTEGQKPASDKVAVLKKRDSIELCKEVLGLTKETAAFKAKYAQIERISKISEKVINDVLKGYEKLSKEAAGEKSNISKALAELRVTIQSGNTTAVKFMSKVPTANVYAGKLALNYVAASLKAHGVKAEEKK